MNQLSLTRFFQHDWHIYPAAVEPMLMALISSVREEDGEPMSQRPSVDIWGDAIPKMEITPGGLAIIPVKGPMMKGATGSDKKYMGVVGHDDIEDDLNEAVAHGAHTILLDMDSPGGTVSGTPELAQAIDDLANSVDIYSFNGSLCASAAEYISAGAVARMGTPSSTNGSIGTILQTVDFSRMLDNLGIKVELIASGKFKGTGHPAKSLTDDQRAYLQDMVKTMADEFKGHMVNHRTSLKEDHMQGQVFNGRKALDIGLLDQLVQNRAAAIKLIS